MNPFVPKWIINELKITLYSSSYIEISVPFQSRQNQLKRSNDSIQN